MTRKINDYEIDKQKKKQSLVRNEFLYNGNSAGKYDFPVIRKQDIDVEKIKLLSYDDPYAKDIMTKCSICGSVALQDRYGNGECKNCGWKFSKDEEMLEQKLGISYPMLVSPTTARAQYKKGLPFKATFKEFISGLYFYSEMLFDYNKTTYEVFLKKDDTIVFCSRDMQQEYKTKQDFENNANINGILLKDLWGKIENPSFMYCG